MAGSGKSGKRTFAGVSSARNTSCVKRASVVKARQAVGISGKDSLAVVLTTAIETAKKRKDKSARSKEAKKKFINKVKAEVTHADAKQKKKEFEFAGVGQDEHLQKQLHNGKIEDENEDLKLALN